MATTQYNLLDDDGTIFLVNYIFTKLKNSPLSKNTTYTLSKDTKHNKYILTDSDGNVQDVTYDIYELATSSTDGLLAHADYSKLQGVAAGAQVNIIEKVKVNGTELIINTADKSVNIVTITEAEVDAKIADAVGQITGIAFGVVNSYGDLPQIGTTGTIYLVPNSGTGTNIYDEYIYVSNHYEKIGTTDVDLSGYVQYTDISTISNNEIAGIVDDAYDDVFNP